MSSNHFSPNTLANKMSCKWKCPNSLLIHLPSTFLCHPPRPSITLSIMHSSLPFSILLLKWMSYCSTHVTPSHPSVSPPSSLTLRPLHPSFRPPCSLPSCRDCQWNITVTPWCIHPFGRAHTLLLVFLRTELTPPLPSVLLVRYWGFGVSSQGGWGAN